MCIYIHIFIYYKLICIHTHILVYNNLEQRTIRRIDVFNFSIWKPSYLCSWVLGTAKVLFPPDKENGVKINFFSSSINHAMLSE